VGIALLPGAPKGEHGLGWVCSGSLARSYRAILVRVGSGRVWGGGRIRNWDGVEEADEQSSQSLGVAAVAGL
jgi:hypothetical protein